MLFWRKNQYLWLALWLCFVWLLYLAIYPNIYIASTQEMQPLMQDSKTEGDPKLSTAPFSEHSTNSSVEKMSETGPPPTEEIDSGPEHSMHPWVYESLNNFFNAFPTDVQPIIIDEELFKCLSNRHNCYEINNKTFLRLALLTFTGEWKQIKKSKIGAVQFKHYNRVMFKFGQMHVYVSEMVQERHYWFVPGEESVQVADLRLLFSPFKELTLFGRSTVRVFENADLYLRQLRYSHFIPCKANLAAKLKRENPELYLAENRVIKGDAVETMAKLRDAFYELNVYPFLYSGTMLGWYRECDIIPHTTDIDFGAFSTELTHQTAEQMVNIHGNCTVSDVNGHINATDQFLYEMRLSCDEVAIDVFAIYSDENSSWSGLWGSDNIYRQVVPLINNLCTADLRGQLFFVPCKVEAILEKEYGVNWQSIVHDDNYGYIKLDFFATRNSTSI